MTTTHDRPDGHTVYGTQLRLAVGAPNLPADQPPTDAHIRLAGGDDPNIRSGQLTHDAHSGLAAAEQSPEPTNAPMRPKLSSSPRALTPPEPAIAAAVPKAESPVPKALTRRAAVRIGSIPKFGALRLADPLLALAADVLDDLECVRIANGNRLRQLTRDETDADGEERGFGLTLDHPDVRRLAGLVEALAQAEHNAELQLRRQLRAHPLGPWVKQAKGVGDKQAARLLAAIGDPYWNDLHDRPRTVSELWSYCGYHVLLVGHGRTDLHRGNADEALPPAGHRGIDAQGAVASGNPTGGNPDQGRLDAQLRFVGVAATRARGQRANWSATAKMRGHLVAASIVMQLCAPCKRTRPKGQAWVEHVDECTCSPYRVLYDDARRKYAGSVHPVECKRCGPAGKPALVGSPRSAGHQEAMAYRIVVKRILRDLWREAKRLHEEAAP